MNQDTKRFPYLDDILEQPKALRNTLEKLGSLNIRAGLPELIGTKPIVLAGMGSSLYALIPLQQTLLEHGCPAIFVETSELIHHQRGWLDLGGLVVVVSQSGASAETVSLLKLLSPDRPIVAVTNTPESPLAKRAIYLVPLVAGSETSVSCKTYVATLAGLSWLGEVLCKRDPAALLGRLASAPSAAELYLQRWGAHVEQLKTLLDIRRMTFFVGRGRSLAAAFTAGLITKESTGVAAEGMSSAAFRHGPLELCGPDLQIIIFEGEASTRSLNLGLAGELQEAGAHVFTIGTACSETCFSIPDCPEEVRPMLEILPVQMATLALAASAGREAGRFIRAHKVTTTE